MPLNIKLYRIFLSSPNDLIEERASLEGVTKELNLQYSSKKIQFELIKWETHAYPGFGDDPQDVINREIDDYDVFVGLMWKRFGTATKRADSGTEEEFLKAYEKYKTNKTGVKILFYFNTKPIPFNEIDPEQIGKIQKFKRELGGKGGLYWEYSDVMELERYVRVHLPKVIEEFETPALTNSNSEVAVLLRNNDSEEELGVYELTVMIEDTFRELTDVMGIMTEITGDFTTKITFRTSELQRVNSTGILNSREAVKVLDNTARDMMSYVSRMDAELPIFKENLSRGLESIIAVLQNLNQYKQENDVNFNIVFSALTSFNESVGSSINHSVGFRDELKLFPNLTGKLNKSKKEVIRVLDTIIKEMTLGKNQVDQFIMSL